MTTAEFLNPFCVLRHLDTSQVANIFMTNVIDTPTRGLLKSELQVHYNTVLDFDGQVAEK